MAIDRAIDNNRFSNVMRIPVALEGKVTAKLEEALALDIIKPVTGHSDWISPMVIAFKENGVIRI